MSRLIALARFVQRQLPRWAKLMAIVMLISSLCAVGGTWNAHPAAADPLNSCSTTTGEIVVVDFAPWGGDIERGCAATLTTGYNAMYSAVFTPGGVNGESALMCRIN